MYRNACAVGFLVVALAGLGGCSGEPAKDTKKASAVKDRIQGKAQVVLAESSPADAALSAGGDSVYIWEGLRRYRLFLRNPAEIEGGKEYIVEGVHAQKLIDELGDPDNGKNGYPLAASCERVVKAAWPGLSFDVTDGYAATLRNRVRRYPGRPVFLVTGIQPVESKEADAADSKKTPPKEAPEISVPAEKQRALLVEGPTVLPAPLWEPKGGTARCKLLIDTEGKVSELDTGAQLCEIVPWAQFRFQPTVQRGRPVNVRTEVEIRYEPRT